MQGIEDQSEAGDQPPALGAFAEVMFHPAARPRFELAVQVRGHAIGRPPMIHPEAHPVHELPHSA
jgi:hypothetical protein